MIVLDTSSLIRFFTNDIPWQAKKIKDLLESDEQLIVPNVVLPELEYVLQGELYQATRQQTIDTFQYLIHQKNITLSSEAKKAVILYEETNLDMADCFIAAQALQDDNQLCSFDKKLLAIQGVDSYFR